MSSRPALSKYILNLKKIINKIEYDSTEIVSFGKYKNKTYYELYSDSKYKKWILTRKADTISMISIQEYCRKLDMLINIY